MAKRVSLYQKPTCRTCSRTREWLSHQDGVEVLEHDIVRRPPGAEMLARFVDGDGEELRRYLNTRSGPYRRHRLSAKLPERERLLSLMAEEPDLIRRPLVVRGKRAVFGHDEEALRALLD